VVCANLISSLLMAERKRILARVHADGVLVVAGILEEEFAQVQRSFEAAGLRLTAGRTQKEWRCGAFCWR
jgi:ribosomal protein L11 methylase PrmA